MNKKFTFLLVFIFSSVTGFCQIKTTAFKQDSVVKPIIFYGYDFTHVKLVDLNRTEKGLQQFIPKISKYLAKKIPVRTFENLTALDTVTFEFTPTTKLNEQINPSNILTSRKFKISNDSLQNYIDAYDFPDDKGTGILAIFESFEQETKTTSAYLVIFDIESHKIIFTEYMNSYDDIKYNPMAPFAAWTTGSYIAVVKLAKRVSWDEIKRQKEAALIAKYYIPDTTFTPRIFQNSRNELPVTFGINPVIGVSTTALSGGLQVNADIYHIIIGYSYLANPVMAFVYDYSYIENAFYLGY